MKTKDEVINGYLERHTPEGQTIRSELENIWENGYIRGRRDFGALDVTEELHRQYNKGYANGYDAGKDVEAYQDGYDKGADDARYVLWWAVSKVILSPDRGGLGGIAVEKIFNTYFLEDIFMNFTPEEIIKKVKDYKEGPKKSAPTNRDKFEEVFGLTIECNTNLDRDRRAFTIQSKDESWRKKQSEWLDSPYKEQKE